MNGKEEAGSGEGGSEGYEEDLQGAKKRKRKGGEVGGGKTSLSEKKKKGEEKAMKRGRQIVDTDKDSAQGGAKKGDKDKLASFSKSTPSASKRRMGVENRKPCPSPKV